MTRQWTAVEDPVQVHNIVVVEKIGRISIDGVANGRPVAVVFMESEVPASVKTPAQMTNYMKKRLQQKADELAAEESARTESEPAADGGE